MNSKIFSSLLLSIFIFTFSFAQQTVTVEEVVQMAIQKNYDIRVGRPTAATQFTDQRFIYGAFLATLILTGSYLKNNNSIVNQAFPINYNTGLPQDGSAKSFQGISFNTNPSLFATWTIFDGTKMFATRKKLMQLADWGETNIRNQVVNTVAATMTNFYNIVRQQKQLKAIEEVMAVTIERVKLAERKLEVGTGAKPELLQAKVDLNAQRVLVVQQEILIQQIKDQMNGQLGFGLPDQYDIADTIPINMNLNFDEIVSSIENSNQTVLAAKKNLEVATIAIRENQAGRYPVLQLLSSYGLSRSENAVQYSAAVQKLQHTQPFSIGATISVPILNNMNQSRLIAQTRVTQSRMQAIYDQ